RRRANVSSPGLDPGGDHCRLRPANGRRAGRGHVLLEGPPDRHVKVLFAPDSFKGTLSSVAVARALAAGWARARPQDELLLSPLADGGEGTLDAIEAAGGGTR